MKTLYIVLLSAVTAIVTTALIVPAFVHGSSEPPIVQSEVKVPRETSIVKPDPLLENCYLFVKSLIPSLPLTQKLKPNTTPHVGAVALFDYQGLPHYAVITKLSEKTFSVVETNYKAGQKTTRDVPYEDPALVGFWAN